MSKRTSRAVSRSYRTVSRTSDADELLFGSTQPASRRMQTQGSALSGFFAGEGTTQHGAGGRFSTRTRSATKKNKPEVRTIVTKDGIRTLRVPRKEPENPVLVLSRDEFVRLKQNAKVKTKAEIEAEKRRRQEERRRLAEESDRRKAEMEKLEAQRAKRAMDEKKSIEEECKEEEKRLDEVAERHALEARRQQEAVERPAARRRGKRQRQSARSTPTRMHTLLYSSSTLHCAIEEMQRTREEQIWAKQQYMAMQAQQDMAEFENVLQSQQQMIEAEKRKEQQEQGKKMQHAQAVRQQISEQERERRREREGFFAEGRQLHEEAEARKRRLNEIKQRKLQELKALGIDPKYVAPVERLISAPDKPKLSAPT
ncbi:hypothetical protein PTSG_08084 [Salpingoeca rosetta]|uniref:Cilia- and flagella-associated protein 45 n=1 Tax=Salpingoeca rosetta (strain ATCC 50818 / BSB-021) TaxID=946362 RepID=F2UHY4_SALR5|nr:uncharacterized protein PTSG_08084 [Salpingoeca rosetta]EGD76733.1 hypothetical protein PTSG_08084 [Salpingoeca rosetta]|eukprot:XP_004991105.1 hypothetical protein PTSG_08084 [Salpingoeca rosetta]